ncbi:hypothetical protein GC194_02025 [bacterium]|nr:hypothetical protein [bacterium]
MKKSLMLFLFIPFLTFAQGDKTATHIAFSYQVNSKFSDIKSRKTHQAADYQCYTAQISRLIESGNILLGFSAGPYLMHNSYSKNNSYGLQMQFSVRNRSPYSLMATIGKEMISPENTGFYEVVAIGVNPFPLIVDDSSERRRKKKDYSLTSFYFSIGHYETLTFGMAILYSFRLSPVSGN